MKRVKWLGLVSVIVFAVSAIGAATASAALPEFLGTLPNKFSTAGGAASFSGHGLTTVKCTSSKGTTSGNEVTAAKLGKFDELFEGCTASVAGITVKCVGTGDATGTILASGTFTLGYELGTKNPVSALGLSAVNFTCASIKSEVKGCFAGKSSPSNSLQKTGKIVGTGSPIEDYTNDSSATAKCELLANVNGGAFTLAVQIVSTELTFANNIEIMA